MTKIIYIHGFKGSYQSDKVQYLKDAFPDADVYGFPVPEKAQDAYLEIDKQLMDAFATDSDVILVGTSLGGFWAQFFANKYALKSVIINVCVAPHISLAEFVGTERAEGWTTADADAYYSFFQHQRAPEYPCVVLLEEGDELFESKFTATLYPTAKVHLLPGGNHRFTNYPKMVEAVQQLKNNEILPIT